MLRPPPSRGLVSEPVSHAAGGVVPAIAVQLLHHLLAVLEKGQSEDALRPHLYAALLSFMQYSQGSRPAQASPHVLKALLQAGKLCIAHLELIHH